VCTCGPPCRLAFSLLVHVSVFYFTHNSLPTFSPSLRSSVLDRNRNHKHVLSKTAAANTRKNFALHIRTTKKDEKIKRRRFNNVTNGSIADISCSKVTMNVSCGNQVAIVIQNFKALESGQGTLELLESNIERCRRIVSDIYNPPIDELLQNGLTYYLKQTLATQTKDHVINDTAWTLLNIVQSGVDAHVSAVMNSGVIEHMVRHLNLPHSTDVYEQIIWCFANIAGDDKIVYLDQLIKTNGFVDTILRVMDPALTKMNKSLLENAAWLVGNIARASPKVSSEIIIKFVSPLTIWFQKYAEANAPAAEFIELMSSLAVITKHSNEALGAICDSRIIDQIPAILKDYMDTNIQRYGVMILGESAGGSHEQTQLVVDCGFPKLAVALLSKGTASYHSRLSQVTLFTISNIAAGSESQIRSITSDHTLVCRIIDLAKNGSFNVKKEALWTLTNILTGQGSLKQANVLVSHGVFEPFCLFMKVNRDTALLISVLESIKVLLDISKERNLNWVEMLDECNGVDCFHDLQQHGDMDVYDLAVSLLVNYLDGDDVEDQNIAPLTSNDNNTFEFGSPASGLHAKRLFAEPSPMKFDFTCPLMMSTDNC
jgi:Atypical Arm repeat